MLIGISDQMGEKTDRLRCEVCQTLILSPINTGFLRPTVATVLTVHGIETSYSSNNDKIHKDRCNSAYHLRYAPKGARQQRRKATMRPTHCKYLNEEKVKQS